ncbi:hypothetical protein ACHAW6_007231 [Cyclotella cf. meneghiniana]
MASETPQSPPALQISPTLPPQPTTATKVVNPYLRVRTKKDGVAVSSPRMKLMQKYSIRCRDCVESTSAMELLRRRRRWRDMELQQQRREPLESRHESPNGSLCDCPRLFLFRHRIIDRTTIRNHSDNDKDIINNQNNCFNDDASSNSTKSPCNQDEERAFLLEHNITELSGEAGSGKTQICLSVCVDCVTITASPDDLTESSQNRNINPSQPNTTKLSTNPQTNPTLQYKAVYISTGSNTSTIAKRLESMVHARLMKDIKKRGHPPSHNSPFMAKEQIRTILSRIYLVFIKNEEDLLDFIQNSLPTLLARGGHNCMTRNKSKIGIVVIDDIASLFRFSDPSLYYSSHSNPTFTRDRSSNLLFISSQLRKLASLHRVPVLVTNQVSAALGLSLLQSCHTSSKEGVVPALGLVWSHCVGTRIILRRSTAGTSWTSIVDEKKKQLNGIDGSYGSLRYARVIKAVNMPMEEREIKFVIGVGEVGII